MHPHRRVGKHNGDTPSRKMEDWSSSTRPARFFYRIITSTVLSQGKLELPDEFVSRFGPELATVALVTVPSGDVWEVGLERIGNRICFAENLKDFMEFYGIRHCYLSIFTYTGDSNFNVVICDNASAEILYHCRITHPPSPTPPHQAAPEIINVDDDDSVSVVKSVIPISSSNDEEESESDSSTVFEVRIRRERRNSRN